MSTGDWIGAVGTIATTIGLTVGATWAYVKFRRRGEHRPRVLHKLDIRFVGRHRGQWILILVAEITNTGLVRWQVSEMTFELRYALASDDLVEGEYSSQGLMLPRLVLEGSWTDPEDDYLFVDPGSVAEFKHVAQVSQDACLVQLSNQFAYSGKRPGGVPEFDSDVFLVATPVDRPGPPR